ncbi:ribosomal-protein-serine acetyltransferase [Thermosporothrix hazakensis]|jgi:ribosomal-protein-serine acetyltransferase|uniref:Ribosomal-protein-serine acetyltransferase n=1 Tax=Thermosporothrix hazakensis TaxID=644383 RepID=A0A326UAQ7_THEHA|nr:GNAT family protein [Thermosporothrix hazakensis]PZW32659.1 ribosomal-protein-serine acetyltransferase [Thermosporothrix hazakensis]GCE50011.1 ribosomal-protein-serine acetyltransferase [Thermosporothrix hazakensis]
MPVSPLSIRVDDEIELRLHEQRYAEEFYTLTRRNIEHLRPWMPWAKPDYSFEDSQAYMQASMEDFARGQQLPTSIWYRGHIVGAIGFPRIQHMRRMAEIGYWLDKDAQGKGIITRATSALVTYAFQEYGFNKVEIHAAAGNKRSRAVPERLGFTQEGILRQYEWLHDTPHDLVIYGMLASEWQAK